MFAARSRFFVSRKCTACKVAMSDPLVIFDSRHSDFFFPLPLTGGLSANERKAERL
jgi:hypothetical protein